MHDFLPYMRPLSHAVALADHGHFGRAAAAVGLSQPAFSRSIQAFERRLGCQLFERERGRVVPTPFGRAVVARSRKLMHDVSELHREVDLLKGGDTGELAVAIGTYPAELCVPWALRRLLVAHPRLTVKVRVRDWQGVAAEVASETADLGVGEISGVEGSDTIDAVLLGAHPVRFVCRPGHPLTRRRSLSFADILGYPVAATTWPPRVARMLPKAPVAAGSVDPATGRFLPAVTVDRLSDAKELVRETDIVAPMMRVQCADELAAGTLVLLPFRAPFAATRYGFLWRKGRMRSPAALAFAEAVLAAEADLSAREHELSRTFP